MALNEKASFYLKGAQIVFFMQIYLYNDYQRKVERSDVTGGYRWSVRIVVSVV